MAAFPHVWTTSSQTGAGIAELRAHLASLSLPPSGPDLKLGASGLGFGLGIWRQSCL